VDASDDFKKFADIKAKWEDDKLANPVADALRKKLVQYLDMRIGAMQGAPALAANKSRREFDEMIVIIQKKYHVKLK